MNEMNSMSVHTVACLAEIMCRVVDRMSKRPLTDAEKVSKVTQAIDPKALEGVTA